MSSYQREHNIGATESDEDDEDRQVRYAGLHPTLNQSLQQFMARAPANSMDEGQTRQIMEAMASYVTPGGQPIGGTGNGALFNTMLNSLLSSPDTVMVLEGGGKSSKGVDDQFLDTLDRVSIEELPSDARCPICTNSFEQAEFPLIVRLPCDSKHYFDLECITPWLKLNKTCPLCREEVTTVRSRRLAEAVSKVDDDEERDEDWGFYG